jgi:hypothetical protein
MLEHFHIVEEARSMQPLWPDDLEKQTMVGTFSSIYHFEESLPSREHVPRIVPTLQELVGERVTEVLPTLQCIFLQDLQESEFIPEAMQQFIAARQLSSRPIAIFYWNGWPTIDIDD